MTKPNRIRLDIKAVETRLGCHRQTIWRWYTTRDFPKPHYLGQNRLWWEDEIEAWEEQQMLTQFSGHPQGPSPDSFFTKSGNSPPNEGNDEGGAA
jgi:predicted DNA-binding transcriptional regulator AlpA